MQPSGMLNSQHTLCNLWLSIRPYQGRAQKIETGKAAKK